MDGALIVYDASTLTEIKRLPMSKPVGKYNVYKQNHPIRRHLALTPCGFLGCSWLIKS